MNRRTAVLGLLALLCLPPAARADLDLWPALVLSEQETVVLYPFWVRERQTARITRVEADRVEVLLGPDEEDERESIGPGESFAGLTFEELARRGAGPVETPDFLMAFPWYYRTGHGRDHHVLWPLFKSSRGRVERVAPLWFRGENSFTLLPIIHRTPEVTLWAVPPSILRRDGSMRAVFPLFVQDRHRLAVFPTWYRSREPGKRAVDAVFPLWYRSHDATAYTAHVLLLFGRERAPDTASDWVLPLYYDRREAERRRTGLVFPLYYRDREKERTRTWLLPVFVERGARATRTWAIPFWLSTHEQREGGETRTWLSVLWPLYAREEVRSSGGELIERRRRFAVFGDRLARDGRRTFTILGIPVRESL